MILLTAALPNVPAHIAPVALDSYAFALRSICIGALHLNLRYCSGQREDLGQHAFCLLLGIWAAWRCKRWQIHSLDGLASNAHLLARVAHPGVYFLTWPKRHACCGRTQMRARPF